MKKFIATTVVAGLVTGMSYAEEEVAVEEEVGPVVSVSLDLASAYVYRGITLNDGAVFQPGITVSDFGLAEEYGAIVFGAWGNYDFNSYAPNTVAGSSFQETDWYASYSLPSLVDGLDLYIGYTEYSYASGVSDKEANIGAGFDIAGLALGLAYYQGVGGGIDTQVYLEGTIGYAMDISDELSGSVDASLAYVDPSSGNGKTGFHNFTIGASLGYALSEKWSAGASVVYIGQADDKVLVDSTKLTPGYDVELVGMVGLSCEM